MHYNNQQQQSAAQQSAQQDDFIVCQIDAAGCAAVGATQQQPRQKFYERGAKAEVAEIFDRHKLTPNVHFTTWDDYAIMSMVESGLGISILPQLILQRVPYQIVTRELTVPAYREIALALRDSKSCSLAVKRFLEYLSYR